VISEVTGAEAGYATAGAAAVLTRAAAACLTGLDLTKMERLPATDDWPNEIIVCREQRCCRPQVTSGGSSTLAPTWSHLAEAKGCVDHRVPGS
jgi:hypothetical protein